MAEDVMRMVSSLETVEDRHLLRGAAVAESPGERLLRFMPGLPDECYWVTDTQDLRRDLPEIHETIILAYLAGSAARPEDAKGRNLYRGLQRALDQGVMDGLAGVPPPADGGVLWLRLR